MVALFFEFGDAPTRTVQLSSHMQTAIGELKAIPPQLLLQPHQCMQTQRTLAAVCVFRAAEPPTWERYAQGGQLSWRGAINPLKMQKLWRTLCCACLSDDAPAAFAGFRLSNKSKGASQQIKIELWTRNTDWQRSRRWIVGLVGDTLPACDSQFEFVSHAEKMSLSQR